MSCGGRLSVAITRKQFDSFVRKLSVLDSTDRQHHCRVEICIMPPDGGTESDWRVLTDACRREENVPLVHRALCDMLWVYVSENYPDIAPAQCRKLGAPKTALDKGMRVW